MNKKILICAFIIFLVHLGGIHTVWGASFSDMFGGGKKESEYKVLLQQKDQECQALISEKERLHRESLMDARESADTVQALREKNSTLMEAYEKIKTEQDGIYEQLTRLRRDNERCDEMKVSFNDAAEQSKASLDEKERLEGELKSLNANLDNLKRHVAQLTEDQNSLNAQLTEARAGEATKVKKIRKKVKDEMSHLREQLAQLTKENKELKRDGQEAQKSVRLLENTNLGLEQEIDLVKADLAAMEEHYTKIQKENRYLAEETSEFPKKFADIARHNRKLIKETSDIHYNLGVSYIKNKEYKRAVREFEKVLELKPDDPFANYNMGYLYAEHIVDRPTAIKYFQNYLANATDAKDADWVRKYILTWQTWYGTEKLK